MKILAIETSCDETSISLLKNKDVIDCLTWSQAAKFQVFGGVVPQIASQLHSIKLPLLLEKIIERNQLKWNEINLIAYTKEPGLIGCLKIGETLAKSIALSKNIDCVPINHLHGHIYASTIEGEIDFPSLGIILSGGHTQVVYMKKHLDFKVISNTLDDAVGEVIDKIGRKIGLNYPAGAEIEKLAKNGKKTYNFSIYKNLKNYNFSFSGLKSDAIRKIDKIGLKNIKKKNFVFSLQIDIFENIKNKIKEITKKYKTKNIIIGGGVASNMQLKKIMQELPMKIIIPPKKYCTDNAAMIGVVAFYQFLKLKKEKKNKQLT